MPLTAGSLTDTNPAKAAVHKGLGYLPSTSNGLPSGNTATINGRGSQPAVTESMPQSTQLTTRTAWTESGPLPKTQPAVGQAANPALCAPIAASAAAGADAARASIKNTTAAYGAVPTVQRPTSYAAAYDPPTKVAWQAVKHAWAAPDRSCGMASGPAVPRPCPVADMRYAAYGGVRKHEPHLG